LLIAATIGSKDACKALGKDFLTEMVDILVCILVEI
jgi:hypothetical protein